MFIQKDSLYFVLSSYRKSFYHDSGKRKQQYRNSYPGTNAQYSISHIRPYRHLFQTSDYCLVSTELSEELIDYIIKECYRNNVKTFVKPIFRLSEELLPRISFIIPNSRELDNLVPGDESYEEKAEYLYHKGCSNVIVTLEIRGSYLRNKDYSIHIPAIKFNTVDSNGAANCFISALAVALSQSHPSAFILSASLLMQQESALLSREL